MATKEKINIPTKEEAKIVKAKIAFTRQSPRKVRRTANLLRNLTAGEALNQLAFMPYEAANCLTKLLESAMSNASHNLEIENPQDLKISELLVDEGLTYKRWRAMSKGRAYSIMKRTAKLSLILSEMSAADYAKFVWENSPRNKKNSVKKTKETKKVEAKKTDKKVEAKKETKAKTTKKTATKKATTKKQEADS